MAVGDVSYTWLSSGSVAASANGAFSLLHNNQASYAGLSDLNASDVLHIQLMASGADMRILKDADDIGVEVGQYFKEDINAYVDLPPMKVSAASKLAFLNQTAGDNTVPRWMIWQRVAL